MKILAVSDYTVPDLFKKRDNQLFRKIDLILSCGDLPPEYLTRLYRLFNRPLFYVRGNHDIRYDSRQPEGGLNIGSRLIIFKGFRILGLPGSRWYNGGANQYTEFQMRRMIWKLRPGIWWNRGLHFVITHAPPRFIHDEEDRCHRGFKSFRWLIDHYSPDYLFHGHIHRTFDKPSDRMTFVNDTKVINVCGYCVVDTENEQSI